ncbi:hypothetical protein [Blastococcus sp. TF02A_35]|nr:hypothetical protein [Blastococcus sp. TF02A_35]
MGLRFQGEAEDGTQLHELRAAHVTEVLQVITEDVRRRYFKAP